MKAPGRFLVLRGTRPQSRKLCLRAGLRSAVLVDGEPVTIFADRRQARRAINRTVAAVDALGARSLHRDWLKDRPEFASLFSGEPFTIVPVELLTASGAVAEVVATGRIVDNGRDAQAENAPGAVTAVRSLFDDPVQLSPAQSIRLDDPAACGPNAPFNSVDCRP